MSLSIYLLYDLNLGSDGMLFFCSLMKCHMSLQAASVHGKRQWKEWKISHHLRLWDKVFSWLQIILPGGERNIFDFCCHVYVSEWKHVKMLKLCEYMRWALFLCRVIISGIMKWWSSGKAPTGNSHTPTWYRATAPSASPGHFNELKNFLWWEKQLITQQVITLHF